MFDEIKLREEIHKVWGEHGAHADVYEDLLRRAARAPHLARQAEWLQALWDVTWHTGRGVTLRIGGTHDVITEVWVGDRIIRGNHDDVHARMWRWAQLLKKRKANEPLPEPPE